jgi:flagellar hook protein FlgE
MGLRDMFSAISGLQANSTWLDVIGNNISNTNTVAYKASRVEFADQFSQTLSGGTGDNPSVGLGGVNPEQIGLGTRVASIQTLFTEGTLQQTGISTDIAIVGQGFLVSKSGGSTLLTRAGNLNFDSNGNLTDQNGGLIQGLTASIQYTTKIIGAGQASATAPSTPNLTITAAKLGFQTTSASAASNINIPRDMTMPPNATTVINFSGNLDSFLQATDAAHGGVLNIGTAAAPNLPLALLGVGGLNPAGAFQIAVGAVAGTTDIVQNKDANQGALPDPNPAGRGNVSTANENVWTQPGVGGGVNLAGVQGFNYVWDQQPPQNPAHQIVEQVFDSEGNPRQVTINFYQVNDLGAGGINNPNGPNQVAYAWYAFDTTGGKTATTPNLVGGTGIIEGDVVGGGAGGPGYNRNSAAQGTEFAGDLLFFNTDGSLLSTGGDIIAGTGGGTMAMPDIYLPPLNGPNTAPPAGMGPQAPASPIPTQGAEITQITLNFGTAGIMGQGRRDGVFSDAEGSFQVVNGVNTYVPNSTAFAKSQDGFASGLLSSLSFDATGAINGTFTNGQTTAIGQVVMAMPNNAEGLSKVGSNYYQASPNSGPMFVGFAGQDGVGTIQGDTLELSNVDLTVELSNMIIAQRGFDVNSRVISVENSNLQILSQLGQGG